MRVQPRKDARGKFWAMEWEGLTPDRDGLHRKRHWQWGAGFRYRRPGEAIGVLGPGEMSSTMGAGIQCPARRSARWWISCGARNWKKTLCASGP